MRLIKRALLVIGLFTIILAQCNYSIHITQFVAVCEDNCPENGFYIMTKDQKGDEYFEEMKSQDYDYSGSKFLIITKDNKKNVIFTKEL